MDSANTFLPFGRGQKDELFYNCRVKYYPSEEYPDEILYTSSPIFNPDKVELAEDYLAPLVDALRFPDRASSGAASERELAETDENGAGGNRQSWVRARRRGYDFIRSDPDLDCFVTLTLDPERIDRTSWEEIVTRLSPWLDNRVRRNGLKYILVPEYHKDGESYHFHGLMNASALKLVDSGVRSRYNKPVFNISDYPFGFTTVIKVTGTERTKACAGYIYKYMGKQGAGCHKIGGRYMLVGGKIARPRYEYFRVDFDSIDAAAHPMRDLGVHLKVLSGDRAREEFCGMNL